MCPGPSSYAWLLLACGLCLEAIQAPVKSSLFNVVRRWGSTVCVTDAAGVSTTVRSLSECALMCLHDDGCIGHNFKNSSTCQVFTAACHTDVVQNCVYYEKQLGMTPALHTFLLQQRLSPSASFDRVWADFKVGFDSPTGDYYWIGNDHLNQLTRTECCSVRFDLLGRSDGQWYWAEYSKFIVDDETTNYTLHISGYSGTAGDSMWMPMTYPERDHLDGMQFTTRDRDNDLNPSLNCAKWDWVVGGFWMNSCVQAFINNEDTATGRFAWVGLPTVDHLLSVSRVTLFCM